MNWLNAILEKERKAHLVFFGREFNLSDFDETLKKYGEGKVKEWKKLLLEPHFLPEVEISRKAVFPGFKVRPDSHCYEVVYQDRVLRMIEGELQPDRKAHWLLGQTILIDTRLKPAYDGGKQMWQNENLLGPIIEKLRKDEKIVNSQYGPQSSRFEVSDLNWDEQIKPVLAKNLNLPFFRLERAIEGIVIPQIYLDMPRKDDGTTDTWVWYEEYFGDRSNRLDGGDSAYGGLAVVRWFYSGDRWSFGSFRPLAVL